MTLMGELAIDAGGVRALTHALRTAASHLELDAGLRAVDDEAFASPVADELRDAVAALQNETGALRALVTGLAAAGDRAADELVATDAAVASDLRAR
jgi:hypothetical protein